MAKKYTTEEIMKAIVAACPGAPILLLNFDEAAGTADVAMAVPPRMAALAMRSIGTKMCQSLDIPEDKEN